MAGLRSPYSIEMGPPPETTHVFLGPQAGEREATRSHCSEGHIPEACTRWASKTFISVWGHHGSCPLCTSTRTGFLPILVSIIEGLGVCALPGGLREVTGDGGEGPMWARRSRDALWVLTSRQQGHGQKVAVELTYTALRVPPGRAMPQSPGEPTPHV